MTKRGPCKVDTRVLEWSWLLYSELWQCWWWNSLKGPPLQSATHLSTWISLYIQTVSHILTNNLFLVQSVSLSYHYALPNSRRLSPVTKWRSDVCSAVLGVEQMGTGQSSAFFLYIARPLYHPGTSPTGASKRETWVHLINQLKNL